MALVDLFNPFSSPQYENRLTWAFLTVLNYDPLLQNFLRELVISKLSAGKERKHFDIWIPARISTQTKWIDSDTNRLVSVLLTDETVENIPVKWSDRDPIYDGVIEYPDGLTLIIENKLSQYDAWQGQLCPSRSSFTGEHSEIVLHGSAICLEWPEILEKMLKYADSGVAPFSSRKICMDFLTFVEDIHPKLTPYRTFKLCGKRPESLDRRTRLLVDELGNLSALECRDGWYLFRPNKIAERVGIWAGAASTLVVELWPANTVKQARRFYDMVDRTAFLDLDEWKVEPDLHFSFIQKTQIKEENTLPIDRYFKYFENDQQYGQMDKETLIPLAEQWKEMGIITGVTIQKLQEQFNIKNRTTLNVIPGFSVSRTWKLDTVIELEEQGKLEKHIIQSLDTALDTWGETL